MQAADTEVKGRGFVTNDANSLMRLKLLCLE